MTTNQSTAAEEMFTRFEQDERWMGYGYIGGRYMYLHGDDTDPDVSTPDPELVALADAAILDHARTAEWDAEDIFMWANSKLGRWFADEVYGGGTIERACSTKFNLLRLP